MFEQDPGGLAGREGAGMEGPAGESHPPTGSQVAYATCSAGPSPHPAILKPRLGEPLSWERGQDQLVKSLVNSNSRSMNLKLLLF